MIVNVQVGFLTCFYKTRWKSRFYCGEVYGRDSRIAGNRDFQLFSTNDVI